MQEIVLHIGRHKSGTKSVQKFLADNEDKLAAKGAVYPRAGRLSVDGARPDLGHHRLATLACAGDPEAKSVAQSVLAECQNAPRIVLSSEGFQNLERPQALRDLFPNRRLTVICYVREFLDYVQTSFQQEIKAGGFAGTFHDFVLTRFRVNLEGFFLKWSEASDRFMFAFYSEATLEGGNVIIDFLRRSELADAAGGSTLRGRRFNPSISGNLLGWKVLMNQSGVETPVDFWPKMMEMAHSDARFRGRFFIPPEVADHIRGRGRAYNDFLRFIFGEVPLTEFDAFPAVYDAKTWLEDLARFRAQLPFGAEPPGAEALTEDAMFRLSSRVAEIIRR
jgi:hypothetical protein